MRLTHQVTLQLAGHRQEIKELLGVNRQQIEGQRAAHEKSVQGELEKLTETVHGLDNKIDQKHAQLLTWSFMFWVGGVAAIATLAGILRP